MTRNSARFATLATIAAMTMGALGTVTPARAADPWDQTREALLITSIYDDGSVSVVSFEAPTASANGRIQPRAVHGCTGSGPGAVRTYSNCTVDASSGLISGGFSADYQIWQTATDKITRAYGGGYFCVFPAQCSNKVVRVNRSSENAGNGLPAEAEESFEVSAPAGVFSGQAHIYLRVGRNSASETHLF